MMLGVKTHRASCAVQPFPEQRRSRVRACVSGETIAFSIASAAFGAGVKAFVDQYMATDKKVGEVADKYHQLDKSSGIAFKGFEGQLTLISKQLEQLPHINKQLEQLPHINKQLEQLPHINKQLEQLPHINEQLEQLQRASKHN